jgi:hypothetical protein
MLGNRCIEVFGLTDAELRYNCAPDMATVKIMISKLS